ncbi:MAG: peptidyl-prolyl cis-trans isomerase [Candidatus Omnitrophota bacterium]
MYNNFKFRYNKRKVNIIYAVILIGAVAGCAKKEPAVAVVNNERITEADFDNRVSKLPERYQDMIRADMKKFLDEVIADTLLYQEGVREGLDKKPEVQAVIEEARRKIIIAKLLDEKIDSAIKVDEDEAKNYYAINLDEFRTPEILRASHIMVRDPTEAAAIAGILAGGADFEELARTKSIDASGLKGGDIGNFVRGQVDPDFEKACFTMNEGEISGVVKTRFGYHVIKLTERKPPAVEKFDEVKNRISQNLLVQKKKRAFNELVEGLKNKARIVINEDSRLLSAPGKGKKGDGDKK